jgi:hypothetical protein
MDDALIVSILQGIADLRNDGQRLRWLHAPVPQDFAQIHTIHKFHHQVKKPLGFTEVVDGDDLWMI